MFGRRSLGWVTSISQGGRLPFAGRLFVTVLGTVAGAGILGVCPAPAAVRSHAPGPEVVRLRTANTRTFATGSGRSVLRVYPGPVNFRSGGGWKPIDNTLVAAEGGGFRNRASGYALRLPGDLSEPVRFAQGSSSVTFRLAGAQGQGRVSGATERFAGALPGVAASYSAQAAGVRELLSLRDRHAQSTFRFLVGASAGLKPRVLASGEVLWLDGAGRTQLRFAAPYMTDAAGRVSSAVHTTVTGRPGGWVMTYSADRGWLGARSRSWPVVLDPSVYGHDEGGTETILDADGGYEDTYIQGGSAQDTNFDGSSQLDVGWDGSAAQRALIYFDFQYGWLPAGVHVLDAKLNGRLAAGVASATSIELHRVTHDWSDWQATWNHAASWYSWATPGGEFDSTALSTTSVSGSAGDWQQWDVPGATIEDWNGHRTTGDRDNWGLLLKAAGESGSAHSAAIYSSDDSDSANWPYLQITYVPQTGERRFYTFDSHPLSDRSDLKVNVANGNLLVHANDLRIAGTGLQESLDRYYNHQQERDATDIGAEWLFGQGADVRVAYTSHDEAVYHAPTGAVFAMSHNADGTYTTTVEPSLVLVHNSDGTSTMTDHSSGGTMNFHSDGSLESQTDRNSNTITYHYDSSGHLSSITDTQGRVTDVTTNSDGLISEVTDPASRTYQYGYTYSSAQQAWLLTTYTDPDGKVTGYQYQGDDLTEIDLPNSTHWVISYSNERVSALTQITDTINWTGPQWTYTYDTGTPCDSDQSRTTVTDPNGHDTVYCSDDQGKVHQVQDAAGHTQSRTYTAEANVQTYTDGSGDDTTLGYQDGRISSITQPADSGDTAASSSFDYTGRGADYQPYSATDPQGNVMKYDYDAVGNLKSVKEDSSGAAQALLEYNSNGTVSKSTDGDGAYTTYQYDSDGNPTGITYPTGSGLGSETISTDSLSRVSSITDGKGQKRVYHYDPLDRVTSIDYYDASSALYRTDTYGYDANGNLTSRDDGWGSTTYHYNLANELDSETFPGAHYDHYTYDDAGNLTSITTDDAQQVLYTYTDNNLVQTIQEPGASSPISYLYNDKDQRIQTSFPNGVTQTTGFDKAGRPTSISSTGPGGSPTLTDLAYDWKKPGTSDETDQLQTATDNRLGTSTLYHYDPLNRLTSAATTGSLTDDWSYTYDNASNVLTRVHNGAAHTFAYRAGNELCWQYSGSSSAGCASPPSGATTYTSDADGGMTGSSGGASFSYDPLGQTTSITPPGGSAVSMSYAGSGQDERISKGSTSYYDSVLGTLREVTGSTTTSYTRDDTGQLAGQRIGSARYYYLTDQLGSVIAITDSSGAVADRISYPDPYGSAQTVTGTVPAHYRFAGGYADTDTGLTKFGQRYYSPALMRWTQTDPISQVADSTSNNRYAYVGGDPVNGVDPAGLCIFGGNWCRPIERAATSVNRWTYRNINPFNSDSTVSRFVGNNARELGNAVGCGLSYGLEIPDACEEGYDYNSSEPNYGEHWVP